MASDPSTSACIDMDALAVVDHGSGAGPGTCNNGDNALAVVVPPGLETNSVAQSNITGVFPFKHLPTELQNKIIGCAMRATNRKISFSCLTNAAFKPNVAVALLLVNHQIYHEAHCQLRKQNSFVFSNLGSDLKTVASSIGPLKCRSGACGHGLLKRTLANVVFELGDDDLPEFALDKIYAFGCALRQLRSPLIINSLHIQLGYYSFGSSAQLSDFASALSKIKVQGRVIVTGDKKILDIGLKDLLRKLGMSVLPIHSQLEAYTAEFQLFGTFLHHYIPEKRASEDTEILVADRTHSS